MVYLVSRILRFFSLRKPSTEEILENLTEQIENIKLLNDDYSQRQKNLAFWTSLYAAFIFIVCLLVFFFLKIASVIAYLALFMIPFLMLKSKNIVSWYFNRNINGNKSKLTELESKKRSILDNIKETEPFNKAEALLRKYDDSYEINKKEGSTETKNKGKRNSLEHSVKDRKSLTIRPILPQNRSVTTRLFDILMREGPNNRFALICSSCFGHNGMATEQEFEFIQYRCCYCGFMNPAKKKRMSVPIPPNIDGSSIMEKTESFESDNKKMN